MTNTEAQTWEPTLRTMARRFWRQRAFGHPETLIDDLVQVGYLAVLTYGPAHPHASSRAAFDMRTFLDTWLYGVPPGTDSQARASGLVRPEPVKDRHLTTRTRSPEAVRFNLRKSMFTLLLLFLSVSLAAASGTVTVSWDAPTTNADGSPLTDLAGYQVYYGTTPGSHSTMLKAGTAMQLVVAGLTDGQTYWFSSTALDTSENESVFSEEVAYTVPLPPDDTIPPTVAQSSVVDGATNVDPTSTLTVQFSEAMNPSTIDGATVQLRDAQGTLMAASVTYNAATHTVSLDPSATLAASMTYTLTLNGLTDQAGNALAPVTLHFTTAAAPAWNCPCSVWAPTEVPKIVADPDTQAVELGMKFRSVVAGQVTGVRYYKSTQNTGTHTATLWSRTGQLLASVTFPSNQNTGSGWKQANFATPVTIQANTTYVVTYHTNTGYYAGDKSYFAIARTRGPLTALADGTDGGNGVYRYGKSRGFPTKSYAQSNYFVDIVFLPVF